MIAARIVVLALLLAAAGFFLSFALTGNRRHRHIGLTVLKWTLGAAVFFFAVLIVQELMGDA